MVDTRMWFGTFHHSEWINRPEVGGDMSPKSWGAGGMFLSGGGFEISAPDAHREFSLEWDGAGNSVAAAARMQAYRDGAYSKAPGDLFYFHDPLSYAVNILPKRWAQPSLMVRTKRPWAAAEVPGPGVRDLPLTGAHIVAGTTDPTEPGPGVLYVPIPEGKLVLMGVNQVKVGAGGVYYRRVNEDGTLSTPYSFTGDNPEFLSLAGTVRGALVYFKGEADVFGMRAVVVDGIAALPPDFNSIGWKWHSGMGHSGCRFSGVPTYSPFRDTYGGLASYSVMFREVGDWLQ